MGIYRCSDSDCFCGRDLKHFKLKDGSVKPIVSSGNCIISIVDVAMENAPGVAAKVFKTLAEANVQIMLITTSESQISVLVTRADFDDAVDSLNRQFA